MLACHNGLADLSSTQQAHHLNAEPQGWLDTAQSVPGSWWPAWTEWLAVHAGPLVAAPRQPGNAEHAVIEPAPGRYVKARAP